MVGLSETATKVSALGAIAETLSEQTKFCIERLRSVECELERPDFSPAVLVLLYEKAGELRVVLTTRSKLLRTHPGQTALPGGKVDESDPSLIDTAFREAHEEVGLPLDCAHVHKLCVLQPFLSASRLIVTPVVALLTDFHAVGEVDRIFSHPLEAILDPQGTEHWPYSQDYHSISDVVVEADTSVVYRMHRFRSCASPIKGLTADILIHVAEIAYHKKTSYERHPLGHAGSASYLFDPHMS
ncbi:NUDIX hydrolase domain-like protein [Pisolithus sp. B1]|nr:NUDIX hydrolase domain-like protein [Pisolithus sp. B1]